MTDSRLLAQGATSATANYTYDAASNLAGYTYPNAVQASCTYDPLNRLTQMSSSKGGVLATPIRWARLGIACRLLNWAGAQLTTATMAITG